MALAGGYSAVYPRESPGGWQLIGRTTAELWNIDRPQPALITPGNRVRFTSVREVITTAPKAARTTAERGGAEAALRVISPGLHSVFQDLGRPGYASLGVARSGALDLASFRQANRLVGNPASSAVIESLNGGLVLEALTDQVLAVTGAQAGLTVANPTGAVRPFRGCAPFLLPAGHELRIAAPGRGLRTYTSLRGGFDVKASLGSRSTDSMSGIGPAALVGGQLLPRGKPLPGSVVGDPELPRDPRTPEMLGIIPGPRTDWFEQGEIDRLCAVEWTVTARSNRIGLHLDGPALRRFRHGELASEGTVSGALQVPPSGLPVLFLADHPVTGGYPVIAVVRSDDLDRAAQLPPGSRVRFLCDSRAGESTAGDPTSLSTVSPQLP